MNDMMVNGLPAAGMSYERSRVEMAMLRLSMVDVSFSSPAEANSYVKNAQSTFASSLLTNNLDKNVDTKVVQDPSNPQADANGNVYYLNVDPTHEMATLVAATRAYEANVKAYNINAQMVRAALDMGNK